MTDAEINALIIKSIDNAMQIMVGHLNAAMKVIEAQDRANAEIRNRLMALELRPHFERPNGDR